MKLSILFILLLFRVTLINGNDWTYAAGTCQTNCDAHQYNCLCKFPTLHGSDCLPIPFKWRCDGIADCPDARDEINCTCPEGTTQCSVCKHGGGCETREDRSPAYFCAAECYILDYDQYEISGSDWECDKCNGYIDCPDLLPHDEANCSECPPDSPYRCDCNKKGDMNCKGLGYVCYAVIDLCDGWSDCVDSSDEFDCKCSDEEFTCRCFNFHVNYKHIDIYSHTCQNIYNWECIDMNWVNDGEPDCPDKSDETQFYNAVVWEHCKNVTIQRISQISPYVNLLFDEPVPCNNATRYNTRSLSCTTDDCNATDVICASYNGTNEACSSVMQCSDYTLILASQFCDGISDCPDNSDEIRSQPGFKCEQSEIACSLPQPNLYDDFAHCVDNSDLCDDGNNSCFECFDKRLLISSKQVCDGVIDCYDFSDECLCQINFDKVLCDALFTFNNDSTKGFCKDNAMMNSIDSTLFTTRPELIYALTSNDMIELFNTTTGKSSLKYCETKRGYTTAILCNGRPECRDFSDECNNCEILPDFCNDSCRTFYNYFYPFGDLYCDGVEDEFAWPYINETACPPGFDEKLCPKRFYCKAGDKVSIGVEKVCNGIVDCDNGIDEDKQNCSETIPENNLFSSETEMIANPILRSAFWIIGAVVIFGNLVVIVTKAKYLKTTTFTNSLRCQHVIILYISCADFIMGIYLLTVAIHSALYSGYYGQVDHEWRSSLQCSIIGSLTIISSETSCFLLLILTALRLHTTLKPMTSFTLSKRPWKIAIGIAWLVSLALGVAPIPTRIFHYFVHGIFFPSEFDQLGMWNVTSLTKFACRFAAMTNKTIINEGSEWASAQKFIERNFPKHSPMLEFGYYSETSICMPRIYVERGSRAWEYTLAIITLNCLCFFSIAACYVKLFLATNKMSKMLKDSKNVSKNKSKKQENTMQKRIAMLVATDFFCWIPICIMAFVRLSGVAYPNLVYQISAVFLLPINSAVNPFLYSLLPEILMKIFCKKHQHRSN